MILKVIQQWGRAPTPLIPKSIIQKIGYLDAPKEFEKILGKKITLAELDNTLWKHVGFVNRACLSEIVDVLRPHFSSFAHLRFYSGEQLYRPLKKLPFSTRTKNAVMAYTDKFSAQHIHFRDILSIPSFGVRSAIEFACVVEAAIIAPINYSPNKDKTILLEIGVLFQTISAWALGEQKMESLSGALPAPLVEWPEEIKELWSKLGAMSTGELAGELETRYSVPDLMCHGLGHMDDRLLNIISNRIIVTHDAMTLEELGDKYNITRERVRQLEQKALSKLGQFHESEFLPVLRRAETLREYIGSAVPVPHYFLDDSLNRVVEDFENKSITKEFAKPLLLWLAGPYKLLENWLLIDKQLPKKTITNLMRCRDQQGVIANNEVFEILNGLKIKKMHHQAWLEYLQEFLQMDEGLIHFKGSILEKAKALLQYFRKPMTVEEILKFVGNNSVRSTRQRLIEDPQFWRISKQNEFVMAGTAGYDEYTGIVDEIVQELELCGGQASVTHLVEKLTRIYGVKEHSVIAYLSTPMFTKDKNGIVRIRDVRNGIKISTDIKKTADCYRAANGSWCWRVKINQDIMRGSGCSIPNAFAQLLGCDAGKKTKVSTEYDSVTLSWSLTSTIGATVGSLRQALHNNGAKIGDYLFVKTTLPYVTFEHLESRQVESENSKLVRLALLLGRTRCGGEKEAVSEIANALGVVPAPEEIMLAEARQMLMSRGEAELAELIQRQKLTLDDHINNIGRLFG